MNIGLMQVRPRDIAKLEHTLGVENGRYKKNRWGWRNYYAANPTDEGMLRLEQQGLVKRGHVGETLTYFHATLEGCKLIGLKPAQIKRAFER
jgi:hypothetical protein